MAKSTKSIDYKALLKDGQLLEKARNWLINNPVPKEWQGDKWSYAYTEMPVGKHSIFAFLRVFYK